MSDESHTWARLCHEFHDLRLGANRHELGSRWRELVRQSRDGEPDLQGWEALERKVMQLNEAEDDFTLRGDDWEQTSGDADEWPEPAEDGEFGCPEHRCSRIDHPIFGERPRCELFDKDMIGRPQD